MPKTVIPLTDKVIVNAKPKDKDYSLSDGKGLAILVKVNGSKLWHFNFISPIDDKRRLTSFGIYPDTTLAKARKLRDEARQKIKNGIDITIKRKTAKEVIKAQTHNQFHNIAYEYLTKKLKTEVENITYQKTLRVIERDILPFLATFESNKPQTLENVLYSQSILDITEQQITDIIKHKAKSSLDTAYRLKPVFNAIYKYAKPQGVINITNDITTSDFLPKLNKNKHHSSTIDNQQLKTILDFINGYQGLITTKTALRFMIYTLVRVENVCTVKWSDIDFVKKVWIVPKHKTSKKVGTLILPLTDKAIEALNEVKPFTNHCEYIFPQLNNTLNPKVNYKKHISTNALSKAFRDNGFKGIFSPHGIRAAFKSLAQTHTPQHRQNIQAIEACLFHATEKTEVGKAYGYMSDYTKQMKILLEWWADYLDNELKDL